VYKSAFQLRLFFGHLLSRPRLLSLIDEQRRWLTRSILILEEGSQDLERRMHGPPPVPDLLFPLLETKLKLAGFTAELKWADETLVLLMRGTGGEAANAASREEDPGTSQA
jgi:hypothetical protein